MTNGTWILSSEDESIKATSYNSRFNLFLCCLVQWWQCHPLYCVLSSDCD